MHRSLRRSLPWLLLPACAAPLERPWGAEEASVPARPVHTYSIVARDPATGELGVAVQSHWFQVGVLVPWAEAGVGAVATQSFVNVSFGPRGLALLREGKSAEEALAALLETDEGEAVRQVAIVDARGRVAAHTGSRCIAFASHAVGEGYGVQANMMRNDRVVPAMARAYEAAEGPLAERLLAALEAGEAAGGDVRGSQSAALLVVRSASTGRSWEDRLVDLRVEDHPDPVSELRRLFDVHRAYEHMNAGDAAMETGDFERAMAEYGAAERLQPENLEIRFWTAFALATNGRLEEALPRLERVVEADPSWRELLGRLPAAGLVAPEVVRELLARLDR